MSDRGKAILVIAILAVVAIAAAVAIGFTVSQPDPTQDDLNEKARTYKAMLSSSGPPDPPIDLRQVTVEPSLIPVGQVYTLAKDQTYRLKLPAQPAWLRSTHTIRVRVIEAPGAPDVVLEVAYDPRPAAGYDPDLLKRLRLPLPEESKEEGCVLPVSATPSSGNEDRTWRDLTVSRSGGTLRLKCLADKLRVELR